MTMIPDHGGNCCEESRSVLAPGWKVNVSQQPLEHPLILIIDDSICVRTILEKTLRREGYATLGFADGESALRWLASKDAPLPALIILDVTMPKMDGYTVLRCLRKRSASVHTPVVMLSRHSSLLDRLKGRLAGACVYLTKPYHQQTILEVVRAQLAPQVTIPVAFADGVMRPARPLVTHRTGVRPITLLRMEG